MLGVELDAYLVEILDDKHLARCEPNAPPPSSFVHINQAGSGLLEIVERRIVAVAGGGCSGAGNRPR